MPLDVWNTVLVAANVTLCAVVYDWLWISTYDSSDSRNTSMMPKYWLIIEQRKLKSYRVCPVVFADDGSEQLVRMYITN